MSPGIRGSSFTSDPVLCCAAEPEAAEILTSVTRNEKYPRTEESLRFQARS